MISSLKELLGIVKPLFSILKKILKFLKDKFKTKKHRTKEIIEDSNLVNNFFIPLFNILEDCQNYNNEVFPRKKILKLFNENERELLLLSDSGKLHKEISALKEQCKAMVTIDKLETNSTYALNSISAMREELNKILK